MRPVTCLGNGIRNDQRKHTDGAVMPRNPGVRSGAVVALALSAIALSDAFAQVPLELAALASVKQTLNGAQVSLVSDRERRTEQEEGDLAAKLGFGVTKDAGILACAKQPTCGPTLPEGLLLLSVSSRTIQGTSAEVIVQVLSRLASPRRYRVRLERDRGKWTVLSLSAVVG